MSIPEKVIKEIDMLSEEERQKVLSKIKRGEVWLADVLFKGMRQTKQRPVVIVGNELALDIDVIFAPVTSQQPRNQFDVILEYWEEVGL